MVTLVDGYLSSPKRWYIRDDGRIGGERRSAAGRDGDGHGERDAGGAAGEKERADRHEAINPVPAALSHSSG